MTSTPLLVTKICDFLLNPYNLKEKLFTEPLYRFSLLWFVLPFMFFSFSNGKLAPYILPCYAPLAILLSEGLSTNNISNKLQNWGIRLSLMFMVLALLVVISAQFNLFNLKPFYQSSELHKVILIIFSLMIGAFLIFKALINSNQINRLFLYGISLIGIMLSIHFVLPQKFLDTKAPEDFFLENQHLITPQTMLISDAPLMHAVNWFYKRHEYGLSYPDAKHRYLETEQLLQAIQTRRPLVIVHESSILMTDFPQPTQRYQQGIFVLDYYINRRFPNWSNLKTTIDQLRLYYYLLNIMFSI